MLTLQSYLEENHIYCSYQIWLISPELREFHFIEGTDTMNSEPPKEIIMEGKSSTFTLPNGHYYIYFNYPNHHQLCVILSHPEVQRHSHAQNDRSNTKQQDYSKLLDGQKLQLLYYILYPYYTEYALHSSKYKLDTIIKSIHNTASSLDLEELFSTILSSTLEFIPNADLGSLWVYDEDVQRYICKTSVGNLMTGIKKMQFRNGEAVIGHVAQMDRPKLYRNPAELTRLEEGRVTEENQRHWDGTYNFTENVKSMLTAPIVVGRRTECVMVLCQIKTKHALTERDAQLLRGFSSQVGIALRKARLFADLKEQNELLKKRDEIHGVLTKLSMQNKGVIKVIRELRRMVAQPLLFVDLIEKECLPDYKHLPNDFSYQDLFNYLSSIKQSEYFDISVEIGIDYYIYPIRSGDIVLGCLIIRAEHPLGSLDYLTLEQGTSVLMLELIKKQGLVEFHYKKKRELFHAFLEANDTSTRMMKARDLGMKESAYFVSILFQFSNYHDPQLLEIHIRRLIAQVKRELPSYIQTLFGYHDQVTLLACLDDSSNFALLKQRIDNLMEEVLKTDRIILSVGIGSVYQGVSSIKKSYDESKTALSYLVSQQLPGKAMYSEIGVNRLFIHQDPEELTRFLEDIFSPLQEKPELEETLISYFSFNQNVSKTAKELHVHINTLYQRLKKIREMLGVDFENPDDVLRLQLACYLKKTY